MEGQTSANARISIIVAAIAGFSAGCLAGYLVARKRADNELDSRVNEEVQAVRDHYAAREERIVAHIEANYPADPGRDPAAQADTQLTALGGDVEELRQIRRAASLRGPAMGARRPPGTVGRVLPRIETPGTGIGDPGNTAGPFSDLGDDPGSEDATSNRRDLSSGLPGAAADEDDPAPWPAEDPADGIQQFPELVPEGGSLPLLITRTEFYDHTESTHEKLTITYYAGDGVLADDKNVPIRNAAVVVGGDYLDGFDGPDDPDIVYVRNNRLRIDFEIVRDERGFAETVLNYGRPG